MCPFCKSERPLMKNGSYLRPADGKRMARFKCRDCRRSFSETRFSVSFRLRKRHLEQRAFRLLCCGLSQRRCAFLLGTKPIAIARRVDRFGACGRNNLEVYRKTRPKAQTILLDEMESFEHTKCKPLTMPIAVEEGTRKILALRVGKIAAKGHLAEISRRKYGPRRCERRRCLQELLSELKACLNPKGSIKSDESRHYPLPIKAKFPEVRHIAFKGQRGAVVGQGELKKDGFDPLFTLNHTYAMIRDNLKTLSRRTWCTTKRPDRLESLLYTYAAFHNLWLERKKTSRAKPRLIWSFVIN